MTNANDVRRAHKLLDQIDSLTILSKEQEKLLRSFLPEPPKQKTLEEITIHVLDTWSCTSDNYWGGDGFDPDVSIEDWLGELHAQLKGVKREAAPGLPAGMRIADHADYGRVVVSPSVDIDGCYEIYYLDPGMSSGTDIGDAGPDSLTFIDAEPAKPAHPEFLQTEADYQNAPERTIVTRDGTGTVWMKNSKSWASTDGDYAVSCPDLSVGRRRVLRWGTGE